MIPFHEIMTSYKLKIPLFDVRDTYKDVSDLEGLWIAPWDRHPNASGHELLAARVYRSLWPLIVDEIKKENAKGAIDNE